MEESLNTPNLTAEPKLHNYNRIFKTLLIIVVGLTIPITVFAVRQTQVIKQNASGLARAQETSKLSSNGYIVVLRTPYPSIGSGSLESEINSNQNLFRNDRESFKSQMLRVLNKKNIVNNSQRNFGKTKNYSPDDLGVSEEYSNVFNGMAVDVSDDQAQLIKGLPMVEDVYKDLTVKKTLYDSVPMIHADEIWARRDSSGGRILGQGVNVAVIDTGIDYTHPSLGETKIKERNLIQVSNIDYEKALGGREYFTLGDESYDFDATKLVYISGIDKVSIFDFSSKKTKDIILNTPGIDKPLLNKLQIDGDNIVYYAANDTKGAMFVFNISTAKSKKIINLTLKQNDIALVADFTFENDKITYLKPTSFSYETVSFDLKTLNLKNNSEKLLGKFDSNNLITYFAKGSGTSIAYSIGNNKSECFASKIIIQNINTGEKKEITSPHIGQLADYKNNKLLYKAPCDEFKRSPGTYYLYDLISKKEIRISFDAINNQENITNSYGENFNMGFFDNAQAKIGKDAVFLQKWGVSKIWAYDLNKNVLNKITVFVSGNVLAVRNNKVCFNDRNYDTNHIYCHVYNTDFDYTLPNIFNSKVIGGYNFVSRDSDPFDDNGHGTHVANIVAGNGNPKGVAPGANIVAYKALDDFGSGKISTIIKAIDKSIETRLDRDKSNDIDVVNMSLGADCQARYVKDCGPDDPMSRAVDKATEHGITVVVAAGNLGSEPKTISTPGTARKAITVGAVDKNGKIAEFSSRGPVLWNGDVIHKPDILAPGVNICSAKASIITWDDCSSSYPGNMFISGTSMAAPHVAGAVALMKQLHPDWTPEQIKSKIKNNASDLNYPKDTQGAGLIDLTFLLEKYFGRPSIITPTLPGR